MFLSNPFPGAFGLAIDDLSITLVQLKQHTSLFKKTTYSVSNLRTTTLQPGSIVNGEIAEPELVRRKILHLLGDDKTYKPIKSPWVVINLPEPKTFAKLITIPTPSKDLLPDDIYYHAVKHLPFAIEETYLDWQIITPGEQMTELLLSGVAKNVSDSYTYLLEAAGLNPLALELEAAALTRVLITEGKDYSNEARAILDLGATRSSLVVYDKGTIQFTASITFSAELLTTAVAQGLKISHDEARSVVMTEGIQHSKKYPKYIALIDQQIEKLLVELKQAFVFYRDHFTKTNPITHVTMSGVVAGLTNFDTILSQKLKISAHPGNAWKNIVSGTISEKQKDQGLTVAIALGLALRAARNPLQEDGD